MSVLFPPIAWGLYVVLRVVQQLGGAGVAVAGALAAITLAATAVLVWRLRLFYAVFSDGLEARAVISSVFFFRDRGRVEYIYTYLGQKYVSGNPVHKIKRTEALQVGDNVVVVIDRNNPRRAFIRDLYI